MKYYAQALGIAIKFLDLNETSNNVLNKLVTPTKVKSKESTENKEMK